MFLHQGVKNNTKILYISLEFALIVNVTYFLAECSKKLQFFLLEEIVLPLRLQHLRH